MHRFGRYAVYSLNSKVQRPYLEAEEGQAFMIDKENDGKYYRSVDQYFGQKHEQGL